MFYRPRRVPSNATITLVIGGLILSVALLDVSESGLKIALDQPFPQGTKVRIEAARFSITGQMRWASGREAGLTLDAPLSVSDQAELAGMAWAI